MPYAHGLGPRVAVAVAAVRPVPSVDFTALGDDGGSGTLGTEPDAPGVASLRVWLLVVAYITGHTLGG